MSQHDFFVAETADVLLDSEAIGGDEVKKLGFAETIHWVVEGEGLNLAFLLWKADYVQA